MKKLRIGLIGCGGIARIAHLPSYAKMENVEIVALCDILKDRAEKLAGEYGVSRVFEDYRELLQCNAIDAVDICTPNYLHSIIAVEALERGLHVFCEKPDAVSVPEVLKMQAAAERSGRVLMVMRNNRFYAESFYLRQQIEDGKMGDIYAARCGYIRRRGIPGKGGWFTTKSQSGGGPLIDLGVHMIDLAIWLMGNPRPVVVSGATFCKFAGSDTRSDSFDSQFGDSVAEGTFDVEDLAMGFIRFDNGACLQVECSWASNIGEEDRFVELRGSKAGVSWHHGKEFRLFAEEHGHTVDILPRMPRPDKTHGANLKNFVDVILHGASPLFVPQQGVDMIKILTGIYQSADTGQEVRL